MTAHVKIEKVRHTDTDWEERPISHVGARVTLVVKLWNYADLKGGKFKVTHPGLDPKGVTFEVPERKGTGDRSLRIGPRKALPGDLSRSEQIKCRVTFTRVAPDEAPFTLTAVKHCVVEPSPDVAVRVVADDEAVQASKVLVRTGYVKGLDSKLKITRAGNSGLAGDVANKVRAYSRFFGQFFFKDPEGVERPMPKGLRVAVLLGDHPTNAIDAMLDDDGKLTLEMIGYADVIEQKVLKLRFGSKTKNCVVCELPGDPPTQEMKDEPAEIDDAGNYDRRFFKLPREFSLRQTDWTVTEDDARWVADKGQFEMTKGGRAASLGTSATPVKLVLDPHWQFVKFEFFDRYYGHSDHGDARKSAPPMLLVGDREKPATAGDFDEDVKSNWWIVEGGETVQCVPWLLQRAEDGTADARPSGAEILRFTLRERTCVESTSATARSRVRATQRQLRPGPGRLKFYDLPVDWQSRNYYAALSTTAGEFGWYEDVGVKPTTKTKPLVFCLDDIVLADKDGRRLADWSNADRLAMFINTFDATQGCSPEGVYDPDADQPWLTKELAGTALEKDENYVVQQPTWVRLIAAKGNLFDVFDQRTVASAVFDPAYDVIGARAAVCWVDTLGDLGAAVRVYDEVAKTGSPAPDTRARPLRYFTGASPAATERPFFTIQPHYMQHFAPRQAPYAENSNIAKLGRFDMALLRCCDVGNRATVGSETEVAVSLQYHKMFFQFVMAPVGSEAIFLKTFQRNVMDRWNGIGGVSGDPALGRAQFLPQDPAKKISVTAVCFIQMTPLEQAHFRIKTTDSGAGGRDNRGSQLGTGETAHKETGPASSGSFTSAHEHGHQMGLPDEYNERWDGASFGQASLLQHLPGDPFEQDGRLNVYSEPAAPMMNGNYTVHNRYFWHCAEWVRRRVGFPFKVSLGAYTAYKVPSHPTEQRAFNFWPMAANQNPPDGKPAGTFAPAARCHQFLYALGADKFAVKTLPAKPQTPGITPFDGIVMVAVLLKIVPPQGSETTIKQLVRQLANVGRERDGSKLNYKWYLTGTARHGTPEAWTFTRCLIHFAPRVVVTSPPDLPKGPDWLAEVPAEYRAEAVAIAAETKLNDYWTNHGDPVLREQHRVTVATAIAEPVAAVRATWDADSNDPAPTHQPRPAPFGNIDTLLGEYEAIAAESMLDRGNKLAAIKKACASWLRSNAAHVYAPVVTAMGDRAESKRVTLSALRRVRTLEKEAAGMTAASAKHVEAVTKIEAEHAIHFEVECSFEPAKYPVWKAANPKPDLATDQAWVGTVPVELHANALITGAQAKLKTYKEVSTERRRDRIAGLRTLEGPAAAPGVPTVEDGEALALVRALETQAREYREYLERTMASTSVKLTGDTADELEAGLLEVFPAMLKIEKSAGDIVSGDIKTLLAPLGVDNLGVSAL